MHTYMRPPDLFVDQGSAYTLKDLEWNLTAPGFSLKEASIDTLGSIGMVERYHAPQRSV